MAEDQIKKDEEKFGFAFEGGGQAYVSLAQQA